MANRLGTFLKKKVLGRDVNLVSLDEPYEVMALLLKGHEITGVIDAGAGNGRVSKRLLRRFPAARVYAFEPNPMYTDKLQKYAEAEPRFHPQFLALSDREGTADLYVTESPGCTSLFSPGKRLEQISPEGGSVKRLEKTRITTIDEWARRNGEPAIQVMKFDIQAGELKALCGAVHVLKASTLLVYTEIWFNSVYDDGALYSDIDSFFRAHDFVLYDLFKPRYGPSRMIMWGNAIFVNASRLGL